MDGKYRSEVAYAWPKTFLYLQGNPKTVYLDLNHWISLSKAMSGHKFGGQYCEALEGCLEAAKSGNAIFPISSTTFTEASKISSHRQRRDLRRVIEQVSRYFVVADRSLISRHEIETVLDRLVDPNPRPLPVLDYLDWGVSRAFGRVGGFNVCDRDGNDITPDFRSSFAEGPEAFDAIIATAEWELSRKTLEGPSPDEEPEMRELGWNPKSAYAVAEERAKQENEQVARFDNDPSWRSGRIRDVVSTREMLIEINNALFEALSDRGATLDDAFHGLEESRRAFDSMPSFDVAVSLKTSYHRNSRHRWKANDILDIDAIGATLPYCDIVVIDKAMCSHCERTGLGDRLDTIVLSKLSDLPTYL